MPKWCCAEPLGSWLARWACKWLSSPSKGKTDFIFPTSDACSSARELHQAVVTFDFLLISYASQTLGTDTFVHVRAADSCNVPINVSQDVQWKSTECCCESWLSVGIRINSDEDSSKRLTMLSITSYMFWIKLPDTTGSFFFNFTWHHQNVFPAFVLSLNRMQVTRGHATVLHL